MPWVYALELSEWREAGTIKTDWEENIPGNAQVNDEHGGVCVSRRQRGAVAVIVSERKNPNYQNMAEQMYVDSISEEKKIPPRGSSDWNPPHNLGYGIRISE